MKRQALYSCLTCLPESKEDFRKGAGICLACSYSCHEGHELIELYTKRNFRCDCGTPKTRRKCLLDEKSADNAKNEYNQVTRTHLILSLLFLTPPRSFPSRTTPACTAPAIVPTQTRKTLRRMRTK